MPTSIRYILSAEVLAGSEAAWQATKLGIMVVLHEMRPVRETDAHQTIGLAELVCSILLGLMMRSTMLLGFCMRKCADAGLWSCEWRTSTGSRRAGRWRWTGTGLANQLKTPWKAMTSLQLSARRSMVSRRRVEKYYRCNRSPLPLGAGYNEADRRGRLFSMPLHRSCIRTTSIFRGHGLSPVMTRERDQTISTVP